MFINSPWISDFLSGDLWYHAVRLSKLALFAIGLAASMGAVSLLGGQRQRIAHSRVMIHQPSGGTQGQFSDMEISYHLIKGAEWAVCDYWPSTRRQDFWDDWKGFWPGQLDDSDRSQRIRVMDEYWLAVNKNNEGKWRSIRLFLLAETRRKPWSW